jgi:Na+-driven multidrug efflux pump
MRATGKQKTAAMITFIAYWVIGIPISCMLVYAYGKGLRGLWTGPTFATAFNTGCYLYIFQSLDLHDLVRRNFEQRQKDK